MYICKNDEYKFGATHLDPSKSQDLLSTKSLTTLEENNELTFEESCTFDDEQLFEHEIEEAKEKLLYDLNKSGNHTYESLIKRWVRWFQASTRLDKFRFCSYFIESHSQKLESIILVFFHFKIAKLKMNIFLLLLHEWLHWKFNYM